MEILNLTLKNFRNFSSFSAAFDRKLTIITGPNGSGKSSILEATGLICAIRPVRVQTDLDLVRFGKASAKIEGIVGVESKKTLTINFEVIDETYVKKAYFIDSLKKRLIDLSEFLATVIFAPTDLDLVNGSPAVRRHYVDGLLSVTDRDYWRNLSAYNKVIVRRNKVLGRIGEGHAKRNELDFWDERVLEHGGYISEKRRQFFEFLNFVEAAREGGDLSWTLRQSLLSEAKMASNRERDIATGMTLSGPHRDDFVFLFQGKNLQFFGSRGEQRMAVLSLKLAELEYLANQRGARPVLALDDIFSELDWHHREAVLGVVDKQQTIITAAEVDSVPKSLLGRAKIIRLG